MKTSPLALLVEANPENAMETSAILKSLGFEVLTAADGTTGLRLAYEHLPKLVVLEVNLPQMNGYQVCLRLKRDAETAHIPVIILSFAATSEAILAGVHVGADDYIPKDSFATQNLIATIKSLKILPDE